MGKGRTRNVQAGVLMPAFGHVQGGRYHGWSFCFAGILIEPDGMVMFQMIGGEPGWPFPRSFVVGEGCGDFDRLVGEPKCKSHDVLELIAAALKAGKGPKV